jgi:lactate dehydrogenase-like 2-hydroxyacid dehydrogenase
MKAVLQYSASPGLRQRITALDFPIVIVDETDKGRFRCEMTDAEILLHVLEPVTAAVIDAAPRLRLIQKIGVGVNTIDLDAARHRSIAVCNMPGTNTQAVAEMTLLLMLATLRRLARLDDLTRVAKGGNSSPSCRTILASCRVARSVSSALAPSLGASCRCSRQSAERSSTRAGGRR